jgi:membrane-bound lytic murein transglycosylase B
VAEKAADMDGDGKADIQWRNRVTGDIAVWFMNGTAVKSSALVNRVSFPGHVQESDYQPSVVLWQEVTPAGGAQHSLPNPWLRATAAGRHFLLRLQDRL